MAVQVMVIEIHLWDDQGPEDCNKVLVAIRKNSRVLSALRIDE